MLKKILITIAGMVLVLGLLVGAYVFMIVNLIAAGKDQVIPPEPVTTAEVTAASWRPSLASTGTLTAVQGVTVAAQLDGTVVGISFESGKPVKAGDLLVQMDIGPEEAQLRAAEANVELAQVNLKRTRALLEKNTVSQAQLDTDDAAFKSAQAQAQNIRATIAKKTLRAPFSGRLGVRLINLGQTLKAGDPIVSLQALNPIYADFYLPQQQLSQVSPGLGVNILCDAFPGHPVQGKITAINPDVDTQTRNIRVQATLDNSGELMRPGMFVDVDVLLPTTQQVLTIPGTSILYAPYGDSVFVVQDHKDEKTGKMGKIVHQKFVRLGIRRGDFVAVVSGLAAGETVVTSGVFKLHNNVLVVVDNTLAPDAQLNPKPSDS